MTFLRSIRLRGFKTFGRSTELVFEPGVTVIIGPNGSGKSNITDAVLWVLGEQSPRQLRGRNMQDVIFAGSEGYRRAPFAEVALVLDNSRGNLHTEYTEVEIVRRLQRDGSSEYRLNGGECRLLDVQELLSSAGLGKEMHSVISQGQVDAFLSSTPAERRALVEEAAGLGRYKKRRERTRSKLERVRGNLERVLVLEGEVKKALRPLKAQVNAAEKHTELSEKLADLRARILLQDLGDLESRMWKVRSREESVQEGQRRAEGELQEQRRRREEEEKRFGEILEERDVATADYHQVKGDLDRLGTREESLRRRLEGLKAERQRVEEERVQGETVLAEATEKLSALEGLPDDTLRRLKVVEDAAAHVAEEVRSLRPEMEEDERRVEELRDSILEQESVRSRTQQGLELLEREERELEQRREKAAGEAESARARKAEAEDALEVLRAQLKEERDSAAAAWDSVGAREKELVAAEADAEEARRLLRQGREERESATTRLQVLREALGHREGVSEAARELLESVSGARLLVEAVRVPEGLETALAAALGPLAEGVVVPLRKGGTGVLGVVRDAEGSVELLCPEESSPGREGGEGPPVGRSLWGEVEGPEGIVGLVAALLPPTALVEDLEAAAPANAAAGWRSIDVRGTVVDGPGHAGRRAESGGEGLLPLRAEVEGLETRVPGLEERARTLEEAQTAADDFREKTRLALEDSREEAREVDRRASALQEEVDALSRRVEETEAGVTVAEKERGASSARLEEIQEEKADAHRSLSHTAEELDTAREELSRVRDRAQTSRQRLEYLQGKSAQARMLLIRLRQRERSRSRELEQARAERRGGQVGLNRASIREAVLSGAIPKLEELHGVLLRLIEWFSRSLQQMESQMEEARRSTNAFSDALKEHGRREAELQQTLTELGEELVEVEVERARLEDETSAQKGELEELRRRHQAPRQISGEEACEEDREELLAGIERLERSRERLGPVNPLADQEYQETKERADFLAEQREDLSASIDELQTVIEDLDRHITTEFEDVFAAANDYFREMIEVLFPGGRGEMVLTESPEHSEAATGDREDAAEAEAEGEARAEESIPGVGLKIKLPRKAPQNLNLLSGGEKALAAVAFLFSLFLARPCPFYVLDEVEAALDDVNMGRFLSIVKQYQDQTQFIIITHQRRTMEIASTLYGVAMGKEGTSHVLSRRMAAEGDVV